MWTPATVVTVCTEVDATALVEVTTETRRTGRLCVKLSTNDRIPLLLRGIFIFVIFVKSKMVIGYSYYKGELICKKQ
jgi:hypothetical protein